MQTFRTNFAESGNPSGDGLPHSPADNGKDGWQVIQLETSAAVQPDAHGLRYPFPPQAWNR
jgi:hypothetical protein